MVPIPTVPFASTHDQMNTPMESPEPTKMEMKKKAHIKQTYYQMSKVKAGDQIIDELRKRSKQIRGG